MLRASDAVGADDGERLGDDPLAGQRAAAALIAVGGAEPQRVLARAGGCLRAGPPCSPPGTEFDCEQCSHYSEQCYSEANVVHSNCIFSRVAGPPARRDA